MTKFTITTLVLLTIAGCAHSKSETTRAEPAESAPTKEMAQTTPAVPATEVEDTTAVAADNTKINQVENSVTAQDQGNGTNDLELTRQIRRAVIEDKSLSTSAHNVKIIAQNGSVVLKGPVKTADEIRSIEAKAVQVAGAGRVQNELKVAEK